MTLLRGKRSFFFFFCNPNLAFLGQEACIESEKLNLRRRCWLDLALTLMLMLMLMSREGISDCRTVGGHDGYAAFPSFRRITARVQTQEQITRCPSLSMGAMVLSPGVLQPC